MTTPLVRPLNVDTPIYLSEFPRLTTGKIGLVFNPQIIDKSVAPVTPEEHSEWKIFLQALSVDCIYLFTRIQKQFMPMIGCELHTTTLLGISSGALSELVTPEMVACSVKGTYPNMAFYDFGANPPDKVVDRVTTGTFCLDSWISSTGSTDPSLHVPKPVTADCMKSYESQIGDVFKTGPGLWHEDLAMARSAWQVMLHAIFRRENPEHALKEFMRSGQPNFHAFMKSLP